MATLTHGDSINYAAFTSDFGQREILRKYLDVTIDELGFFDLFDYMNKPVLTVSPTYDNITDGTIYRAPKIKTTAAAGTANTLTTRVFDGTAAVPYPGQTIMFPNGVVALVRTVTANASDWDVALFPYVTGELIPAVTAGDMLAFAGNAQGEGSENLNTKLGTLSTKRSNNIQNFSNYDSISDIAGASTVEIPFGGKYYIVNKKKYEIYLRQRMDIAQAGLYGKKGTTVDANGKKVWLTGGLKDSIAGGGFNFQSAVSGVWNVVTDTKNLVVAMDTARCPMEYNLFAGQTLHLAIDENSMTNTSLTGGAVAVAAYQGADKIKLAFGVQDITFGGYTMHLQRLKQAQHPGTTGQTGFAAMKKDGFLIPVGKVKTKGSEGEIDRMRVRYQAFNGDKDLRYVEVETGALSPNKNSHKMTYDFSVQSNQGFEFAGIEHFGKINVQ